MKKYNILQELYTSQLLNRDVLIKVINNIEAAHNKDTNSKQERWADLLDHVETDDQIMVV